MKSIVLLSLITLFSCSSLAKRSSLPTVEYVDLERYVGKWYEVARFDQKFQKGCTATTAEYSFRSDGDIKVVNSCRLGSPEGELKSGEARAWVKDKKSNSKLKVQFFAKGLKLGIFAGDYWILDLGKNYEYAMVGDKKRKSLWFLSRTRDISDELMEKLILKAEMLGFDTDKLIFTQYGLD